jgi:hypothetical protein
MHSELKRKCPIRGAKNNKHEGRNNKHKKEMKKHKKKKNQEL